MADLKYDTDSMRTVASEYRAIAEKMSTLEVTLKNAISELKDEYWRSDAGDAFQEMYEEDWAKNVDKYVLVLGEMARQLDIAADDYDQVTARLREIDGISV